MTDPELFLLDEPAAGWTWVVEELVPRFADLPPTRTHRRWCW